MSARRHCVGHTRAAGRPTASIPARCAVHLQHHARPSHGHDYAQHPKTSRVLVVPFVLLIGTLLRLGLNVASTRVVLVDGHTGTDAAGKVIESFGEFVIAGNYVVGFIIFLI